MASITGAQLPHPPQVESDWFLTSDLQQSLLPHSHAGWLRRAPLGQLQATRRPVGTGMLRFGPQLQGGLCGLTGQVPAKGRGYVRTPAQEAQVSWEGAGAEVLGCPLSRGLNRDPHSVGTCS